MSASEAIGLVLRQERDHDPFDPNHLAATPTHEHGVAVLGTLAQLHAQGHALAVDICNLQADNLAGAQASAIGHLPGHLVLHAAGRSDKA